VCSDGREYLESVFYARGSREKEIIVNALKDGSHYIEDVKTKNSQGLEIISFKIDLGLLF